ncbi:tripartite tricarboxylate transporter substrate-binding protein [Aeromicrobium sp. CF4.19]|uniref:tripartite tricarboxylate transporter substrate-binding protein n=1 Tax=Aeromicrobium sp. CF4.19 TaxID=3373082 RepID=UPI003EE7E507
MRTRLIQLGVVTLALTAVAACGSDSEGGAGADGEFSPDGAVEMVVGAQPGGGSDVMARTFVSSAEEIRDGLSMTVSNFDSIEAYSYVKGQSGADDVLVTATYGNVILSPIAADLAYLWDDFTPLAMFATDPSFLVVREDSDLESIDDLVAAAGTGDVTMGVVTAEGVNTVHSAQIADSTGIELNNVVFESGAEELAAVLAGDVDAALMEPAEFVQQLDAGEVRAIMVMADEPHPAEELADIPTAADAGIEGEIVTQFRSFFGAPEMSESATDYWVETIEEWATTDSYSEYLETNYLIPTLLVGDELNENLEFLETAARDALAD